MKHYIDIENLREFDIDLGGGLTRASNCKAFDIGDRVTISEKIDGANASVRFNPDTQKFDAFSRKQQLNFQNTLNGFWNLTQTLDLNYDRSRDLIIFGEWTGTRNKIVYDKDKTGKWYVFDIYDFDNSKWMPWDFVKDFCEQNNLKFAHMLYDGPFVSWDHVRSFCHSPYYGETQEGVVVKNQTKLEVDVSGPIYLKVVNKEFAESMIKKPKELDQEKEVFKQKAMESAAQIVTEARVAKMLWKLRDEGVVPGELKPSDMSLVAKNLPKRIYEDCLKEEPEIVKSMGEYAGKSIGSTALKIAREVIVG